MGQRIEILRILIREELSRRERNGERLGGMIRFADIFETLSSDERDHLRMIASKNPRITVEDVSTYLAEIDDEDDEDDDLNEVPPGI
jgi:hypothetical protein